MNFRPGLYIVSTPIGNLNDITIRALETLKNSDIILCEDTRISAKLLAKHNITGSLSIYNDKSDETTRKYIIKNIEAGKVVSLISDAGTPLISDPGYKLVREVKEKGYFIDIASKKFKDDDFYDLVHMNQLGTKRLGNYMYEEFVRQKIAF